jgi:hypothetical protein
VGGLFLLVVAFAGGRALLSGDDAKASDRVLNFGVSAASPPLPAGWPGDERLARAKEVVPLPLPAPLPKPARCDAYGRVSLSIVARYGSDVHFVTYGPCQAPSELQPVFDALELPTSG